MIVECEKIGRPFGVDETTDRLETIFISLVKSAFYDDKATDGHFHTGGKDFIFQKS